ncbi:hypothetical protein HanIR_Chr14g0697551 [Helianthus annuus]|nr:hypothetical protein HanIR_Chr14g0697551 [Helianthus annuus]
MFLVNFFALRHCNGCAWFNDFSLLFVKCNFYHFIYFIFTMLRVDVVVALVLLGTVLRTFLTYKILLLIFCFGLPLYFLYLKIIFYVHILCTGMYTYDLFYIPT